MRAELNALKAERTAAPGPRPRRWRSLRRQLPLPCPPRRPWTKTIGPRRRWSPRASPGVIRAAARSPSPVRSTPPSTMSTTNPDRCRRGSDRRPAAAGSGRHGAGRAREGDPPGILQPTPGAGFGNNRGRRSVARAHPTDADEPDLCRAHPAQNFVHDGQHAAIITPEVWDEVQTWLADRAARARGDGNVATASPLVGKLFDEPRASKSQTETRTCERRHNGQEPASPNSECLRNPLKTPDNARCGDYGLRPTCGWLGREDSRIKY